MFIAVLVIFAIVMFVAIRRGQRSHDAYLRVVRREGLELTDAPFGLTASKLSDLDVCPAGGRNHGLRFAAQSTDPLELGGSRVQADVAVFQWWWEEWANRAGESTGDWVEHDQAVAVVRLPVAMPHVTIAPEKRAARWGIGGRDDVQVESEEFNRRFDVDGHDTDGQLVLRLLDPAFQQLLVEGFDGRQVELAEDLLVVAGRADDTPPPEEPDLQGTVAQLPAARRDALRLADALPASFLRGIA